MATVTSQTWRRRPAPGTAEARTGTVGSPRTRPGHATDRPGTTGAAPARPGLSTVAARPGKVEKPGTVKKLGTVEKPGTVVKPGTVEKLGTVEKPGTVVKPGTVEKLGTVEKPGTVPNTVQETGQDEKKLPDTRMLHVSGYPSYAVAGDIGFAFSRFGRVRVARMTPDEAVVEYSSVREARRALASANTIHVYGEFVRVRPAGERDRARGRDAERFARSKLQGVIIDPQQIPLTGDFLAQVDAVLASIRLTQEEVQSLATLYQDVETTLGAIWPGCQAMPFGSITTGLGIKSSDADCFLCVPAHYGVRPDAYVPLARRCLSSHPQLFAELLAIPRANTPIVKFYHVRTRTACDLSFKTPLGARNSRLVKHLLHADPRLLPVAVILKYWAKVHKLSGSGRLSNYALSMLFIFYIQQPPLAILPSIASLQQDPSDQCIVDYWDTGFVQDKDKLPPLNQRAKETTIAEMLGGFFEFYSTFDFQKMAVTPFLGHAIPKESFRNVEGLPEEYERYKSNVIGELTYPIRYTMPLCIQDPFEQCHNVASAIGAMSVDKLIAYFKFAASAYQQDVPNQLQGFLKKILLEKPVIPKHNKPPEYKMHLPPKLTLPLNFEWKRIIMDSMLTIFKDIWGAELTPTKKEKDTKDREIFAAVMVRALWRRKKFYNQARFVNTKFLDRELMITEEMMQLDLTPINLKFQLRLNYGKRNRKVIISVKHIEGSDLVLLKEFGIYYLSNMYSFMDNLLKPHKTGQVEAATKLVSSLQVNGQESDEESSDDGGQPDDGEVGVKVERPDDVRNEDS